MPAIRHVHSRFIPVLPGEIRPLFDSLWSGSDCDAFPHDRIRPRRSSRQGQQGMVVGTTFGHGPFRFCVDRCEDQRIRAAIITQGYEGWHGFELVPETRNGMAGTLVVHELYATLRPSLWAMWVTAIGNVHDWAVQSCLLRLEQLAVHGKASPSPNPPWYFASLERTLRKVA
jgi:hypothetical protein